MQYENRPVADLKPYENNPRHHPEDQINRLARSIAEFGFTVPVLVDTENRIIAGHGRTLAAEQAGLDEVPVIVADGWTDDQKRAYTILDNQLAESSVWDNETLMGELQSLIESDMDLLDLGLDEDWISSLLPADDFTPNLDPQTAGKMVTAEDMQKAADQQGRRPNAPDLVDIECPHCGEYFTTSRSLL